MLYLIYCKLIGEKKGLQKLDHIHYTFDGSLSIQLCGIISWNFGSSTATASAIRCEMKNFPWTLKIIFQQNFNMFFSKYLHFVSWPAEAEEKRHVPSAGSNEFYNAMRLCSHRFLVDNVYTLPGKHTYTRVSPHPKPSAVATSNCTYTPFLLTMIMMMMIMMIKQFQKNRIATIKHAKHIDYLSGHNNNIRRRRRREKLLTKRTHSTQYLYVEFSGAELSWIM